MIGLRGSIGSARYGICPSPHSPDSTPSTWLIWPTWCLTPFIARVAVEKVLGASLGCTGAKMGEWDIRNLALVGVSQPVWKTATLEKIIHSFWCANLWDLLVVVEKCYMQISSMSPHKHIWVELLQTLLIFSLSSPYCNNFVKELKRMLLECLYSKSLKCLWPWRVNPDLVETSGKSCGCLAVADPRSVPVSTRELSQLLIYSPPTPHLPTPVSWSMGCWNCSCNENYEKHDNYDLVSREARWSQFMMGEQTGSDSMPISCNLVFGVGKDETGKVMAFHAWHMFVYDSICW